MQDDPMLEHELNKVPSYPPDPDCKECHGNGYITLAEMGQSDNEPLYCQVPCPVCQEEKEDAESD